MSEEEKRKFRMAFAKTYLVTSMTLMPIAAIVFMYTSAEFLGWAFAVFMSAMNYVVYRRSI